MAKLILESEDSSTVNESVECLAHVIRVAPAKIGAAYVSVGVNVHDMVSSTGFVSHDWHCLLDFSQQSFCNLVLFRLCGVLSHFLMTSKGTRRTVSDSR